MRKEIFCPMCGAPSDCLSINTTMSSSSKIYNGTITEIEYGKPTFGFACKCCKSKWSFTGGNIYITEMDNSYIELRHIDDRGKSKYCANVKIEYDSGEDYDE